MRGLSEIIEVGEQYPGEVDFSTPLVDELLTEQDLVALAPKKGHAAGTNRIC